MRMSRMENKTSNDGLVSSGWRKTLQGRTNQQRIYSPKRPRANRKIFAIVICSTFRWIFLFSSLLNVFFNQMRWDYFFLCRVEGLSRIHITNQIGYVMRHSRLKSYLSFHTLTFRLLFLVGVARDSLQSVKATRTRVWKPFAGWI